MGHSFAHRYWAEYATLSEHRSDLASSDEVRADFCTGLGDALLVQGFAIDRPTAWAIANCLFARMADEKLYYHTPLHILSILSFAQDHGLDLEPWQELVIWFHDAIYDPAAPPVENEHNSALFARSLLHFYVSEGTLEKTQAAIEATAHHLADINPAFDLILDLDLCNFAWDRPNYTAVGRDIALEYIPVVGQERFQTGRRQFLTRMLAKEFIYRTPFFRTRFEVKAKENLEQDLS